MEIVSVAILALAGLALLGVIAFMLNRAWGDFPKASALPGGPPQSTKGGPGRIASPGPPANDDLEPPGPSYPAGAPEGSLIAVEHPLVRRAIESAMEKGGSPYAAYFIRHGDTVYVNLARVADPGQRERIAAMLHEVNGRGGSGMSMTELMRAVQELTRLS